MWKPIVITPAAIRQRRLRVREAMGLEVFVIETHRDRLIEALLDAERITPQAAVDHWQVAALAEIVREWVVRRLITAEDPLGNPPSSQ